MINLSVGPTGISLRINYRHFEWKLSGDEDSQENWDVFCGNIHSLYRDSCKLPINY